MAHDFVDVPIARYCRASDLIGGLRIWKLHGRRQLRGLRRGAVSMRKLWILVFVLAMPRVAFAQSNKSAWENLSTLQAGHKIEVVEMTSKKVSGAFVSVTDAGISLQVEGGEQTIARQDVRVVKLMKNKHRLRNAAIGAAIGAGAGAGIGAASFHDCTGQAFCIQPGGRGAVAGIGAAAGGVIGAIVGALLPCHETVYRAAGR
jgi:hypothetical protein